MFEEGITGVAVQTIAANDKAERLLRAVREGDGHAVLELFQRLELVSPAELDAQLLRVLNESLVEVVPPNRKDPSASLLFKLLEVVGSTEQADVARDDGIHLEFQ